MSFRFAFRLASGDTVDDPILMDTKHLAEATREFLVGQPRARTPATAAEAFLAFARGRLA